MSDRVRRILSGIPALHARLTVADRAFSRMPLYHVDRELKRMLAREVEDKVGGMMFVGHDIQRFEESFEAKVYAFSEIEMALLVDRIDSGRLG